MKRYRVIMGGETVLTKVPGRYAGSKRAKVFGRLDCPSGKRKMGKRGRVFFADWEDAIEMGFRPCLVCKPELIKMGDRLDGFHPAIAKMHVAIWSSNPRPYPQKPQVCFYVALSWEKERQVNQISLTEWFPCPTAIRKAVAWAKKLGLPVIDRSSPGDDLVRYVPDPNVTISLAQYKERKKVLSSKNRITIARSM